MMSKATPDPDAIGCNGEVAAAPAAFPTFAGSVGTIRPAADVDVEVGTGPIGVIPVSGRV
jgi:hypothetical protein